MTERFEVVDALRVMFVDAADDGEIVVDLYGGGTRPLCASLRFEFADVDGRAHNLAALRRWADDGTVVTYVAKGDYVTLVDAESVVRRGLSTPIA